MKVLQTALFILVAMSIHDESEAFQNNTNYDEAKIPTYPVSYTHLTLPTKA